MSDFQPHTHTVLIVEDDNDIRETLHDLVQLEGYKAATARNGREALELLRAAPTWQPCLILLDLMMPEMNGWEFLEARRKAGVVATVPIVVVTANLYDRPPWGAKKILRKPLDLDALLEMVDQFCGTSADESMKPTQAA